MRTTEHGWACGGGYRVARLGWVGLGRLVIRVLLGSSFLSLCPYISHYLGPFWLCQEAEVQWWEHKGSNKIFSPVHSLFIFDAREGIYFFWGLSCFIQS